VTIDVAAMASSIADTGSVAIYGINFDTAKSGIKPESEPAIDEIAKLLTNSPALKVYIVSQPAPTMIARLAFLRILAGQKPVARFWVPTTHDEDALYVPRSCSAQRTHAFSPQVL